MKLRKRDMAMVYTAPSLERRAIRYVARDNNGRYTALFLTFKELALGATAIFEAVKLFAGYQYLAAFNAPLAAPEKADHFWVGASYQGMLFLILIESAFRKTAMPTPQTSICWLPTMGGLSAPCCLPRWQRSARARQQLFGRGQQHPLRGEPFLLRLASGGMIVKKVTNKMTRCSKSHLHFWRPRCGDCTWLRTDAPALAPQMRDGLPEYTAPWCGTTHSCCGKLVG